MADIETARENVLNSSFDDIKAKFKRINHADDGTNTIAQAYNEQVANFEQNKLDKLFDLEKLEVEQAYNSPAAQKQRYLEAGFNPVLSMYGGADAGNIKNSSSPASHGYSGSAAAVAQGAQAEAAKQNNIINGIGTLNDSVASYYKNLIMSEQAQQEHFDTEYQYTKLMAALDEQKSRVKSNKASAGLNDTINDIKMEELDNMRKSKKSLIDAPMFANKANEANAQNLSEMAAFNHAKTETENVMRKLNVELAEKNIQVAEANRQNIAAATRNLIAQAQMQEYQNDAWNEYGKDADKTLKEGNAGIAHENARRLKDTYMTWVDTVIENLNVQQAQAEYIRNNAEKVWNENVWTKMLHGQTKDFEVLGAVNAVFDTLPFSKFH